MPSARSAEIRCTACHQETLIVRQPVYEGLRKVGDSFACAACGHVYASEAEVPYLEAPTTPGVFSEADRPAKPVLFEAGENRCLCRYCRHYVVNPFTQWCGMHRKEVAATDTCDRFAARDAEPDA